MWRSQVSIKKVLSKNYHNQEAYFFVREDSNDQQIMDEIRIKNQYLSRGMGVFKDGDIVIDIGAHIGFFSVECAIRGGKIIAYEPFPENYKLLVKNIKVNGLKGKIIPYKKAVSDKAGSFDLYTDKVNYGSHSLMKKYVDHPSGNKIEVDVLGINDILADFEKVKLIKLDCEGMEYRILKEANLDKVERIVCELHDRKQSEGLVRNLIPYWFVRYYFGKRLGRLQAKRW